MNTKFIIFGILFGAIATFQYKDSLSIMVDYVIGNIVKDTKLSIGLFVGLVIIIYVLYSSFKLGFKTREEEVGIDINGYSAGKTGINEDFTNLQPAKLDYKMGKDDAIRLTNCPNSYWKHPPANEKIITQRVYTPRGNQLPLIPVSTGPMNAGPSIDGTKNTPKDMFMFAYNQCRPECCPSTYSCDKGCICTTEQQRKFIGVTRGNNKSTLHSNSI